ncbi:MAG TPA: DUF1127 domain-containing protein [Dongiaceae bacterium]|nr:DUF1127 domain-containing protein [Dongiaceae bacterium]
MTTERHDLRPWFKRGSSLAAFQAARLHDGMWHGTEPPTGWLRPAANDAAAEDTVAADAAGSPDPAAALRAAVQVEQADGGQSAFDHLYYAIGPYLQPTLPPDIAARFAFRLIDGGERLVRAVIAWPAGWSQRWAEALMRGHDRRKERRIYDQMTDHMLKDIGLSRCDLYDDLAQRQRSRGPK